MRIVFFCFRPLCFSFFFIASARSGFYCLYSERQDCAVSFSFAFSFLAFICEYNLVLMCATRFLPFLSFAHSLYIYIYMLTRIRAASGLIILCIQPPGFMGVPFMVGMLFSHVCSSMLVRAASGLIISCIQPSGLRGYPLWYE